MIALQLENQSKLKFGLIDYSERYRSVFSLSNRSVGQIRIPAPMIRSLGHEQLVERLKAARNTSRQTYQPDEYFLIAAELADVRQ